MLSPLAHLLQGLLVIAAVAMTGWTLYLLLFSVAGAVGRLPVWTPTASPTARIAVLIPAYKEDAVILATAAEALRQDYPQHLFDVIVIADRLTATTRAKLSEMVRLIAIRPARSTKAIALNEALDRLSADEYDLAVVLDADNIMKSDVLRRFDAAYASGVRAMQGHRVAKNLDTPYACLDAVSEEVNNHVFRKGHAVMGLSSALIGSGMAFDFRLFAEIMRPIRAFSEDKEMELALLRRRVRTAYIEEALIYDEKVGSGPVFAAQRSRWIEGQRRYRKKALKTAMADLRSGGLDFLDKLVQLGLPPRGTLILLAPVLALAALAGAPVWVAIWSSTLALVLVISIVIAVPWGRLGTATVRAMRVLPMALGRLVVAFRASRDRTRNAVHTPHSTPTITATTLRES